MANLQPESRWKNWHWPFIWKEFQKKITVRTPWLSNQGPHRELNVCVFRFRTATALTIQCASQTHRLQPSLTCCFQNSPDCERSQFRCCRRPRYSPPSSGRVLRVPAGCCAPLRHSPPTITDTGIRIPLITVRVWVFKDSWRLKWIVYAGKNVSKRQSIASEPFL